MPPASEFLVTKALRYGWLPDTRRSWIELETDGENSVRLVFADEFPPDLKLCLQTLQGHVADERRKAGLPVIEHSYVGTVDHIEFGRDDVKQIVVIRVRFQNGASQDTPLEKAVLKQTIEYLESALSAFEDQSSAQRH